MAHTADNKTDWAGKPKRKGAAPANPSGPEVERLVRGTGKIVRINVDVPFDLRHRIKAQCAAEGLQMKEAIIEVLEKRFPR